MAHPMLRPLTNDKYGVKRHIINHRSSVIVTGRAVIVILELMWTLPLHLYIYCNFPLKYGGAGIHFDHREKDVCWRINLALYSLTCGEVPALSLLYSASLVNSMKLVIPLHFI